MRVVFLKWGIPRFEPVEDVPESIKIGFILIYSAFCRGGCHEEDDISFIPVTPYFERYHYFNFNYFLFNLIEFNIF